MGKYSVYFSLHAGVVMEVEANSEEEARELAEENFDAPCLCHQCANEVDLSDDGKIIEISKID